MKKHLFLLAAGALALSACTSEEVIDAGVTSNNAIKFESAVNKSVRGVKDLTTSDLGAFKVFAYYTTTGNVTQPVFNNLLVEKAGSLWTYDEDETRYWIPGANYSFYAYSCGTIVDVDAEKFGEFKIDMTSPTRVLQINNFLCDNRHQHDFIFARYNVTAGDTNAPVSFSFKHTLSKLTAKFTNTFPPEYNVVIKSVTVNNIRNTGTFDFTSDWKDVDRVPGEQPFVYLLGAEDTAIMLESTNNEDANPYNLTGVSQSAYVLPFAYTKQSSDNVYLNITIDLMLGSEYVMKGKQLVATLNPNWEEGHSYTYNIELNGSSVNLGKIEFTVSDDLEWDTKGGDSNVSLK